MSSCEWREDGLNIEFGETADEGLFRRYLPLKMKRLHERAIVPARATPGSAAFDLFSTGETEHLGAGRYRLSTGWAFEVPEGHVMLLFSRSGHGAAGIRLSNCVGVVDSDYRGEVGVMLTNDDAQGRREGWAMDNRDAGTRIAQFIILELPNIELEEVHELSDTLRGSGGYGSTG